jgi:hypothetical protein
LGGILFIVEYLLPYWKINKNLFEVVFGFVLVHFVFIIGHQYRITKRPEWQSI